ncbi:hypothetical protein ACO0QE_002856 [Hanseniaspora vineae]
MEPVVCKSLTALKLEVESKIQEEHYEQLSFKQILDKCMINLSTYQQWWKKIEEFQATSFEVLSESQQRQLVLAYENAYFYSKLVVKGSAQIIPRMQEFKILKQQQQLQGKQSDLLQVYDEFMHLLFKYQPNFDTVKSFLNLHSFTKQQKMQLNQQLDLLDSTNNNTISCKLLHFILHHHKNSTLLIDIRPKVEFERYHIKFEKCISIEPISFKETYTDQDVLDRSMCTSPSKDKSLFQSRDMQKFIILYTSSRNPQYYTQLLAFKNILLKKSFEKTLDLQHTKVLILGESVEQWVNMYGYESCTVGSLQNENSEKHTNGVAKTSLLSSPPSSPPSLNYAPLKQQQILQPRGISQGREVLNGSSSNESLKTSYPDPLLSFGNANQLKPALFTNNSPRSSPVPMYSSLPHSQQQQQQQQNNLTSFPHFIHSLHSKGAKLNRETSPQRHTPSQSAVDLVASYPETPALSPSIHKSPSLSMDSSLSAPSTQPAVMQSALSKMLRNGTGKVETSSTAAAPPVSSKFFCTGLINLGNSCYMNCIIQCLLGTPELVQLFLGDDYKRYINMRSKLGSQGVITKNFSDLIHTMSDKNSSVVQPRKFKNACGLVSSIFRNNEQQDCQEFVQFLLDALHEDMNMSEPSSGRKEVSEADELRREQMTMRDASIIEWERYLTTDFSVILDMFQGQYSSRLQCKVCQRTSTTYQPFSVLSVPVPPASSMAQNGGPSAPYKININDCFREFTKVENLGRDELWNCPACKKKQPSTKKITITRLPKNLIIHLKRFDNSLNKNSEFIYYPPVLDLTPFWFDHKPEFYKSAAKEWLPNIQQRIQEPPFKYSLNAVACHTGTLYGGHYTAYVKKENFQNQLNNTQWVYYDDASARKVKNNAEMITSSAYVLFYRKID